MKSLSDVQYKDSSYLVSLTKILGSPIFDVNGYISNEFGMATFKICNIVLADGRELGIGGEHDFPYVETEESFQDQLEFLMTEKEESEDKED